LVVGIMAVIAQAERKINSTRTKAALAEASKRVAVTGQRKHPEIKRLGCPTGAAHLQGRASTTSPCKLSKPMQTTGRRVWRRRSTP